VHTRTPLVVTVHDVAVFRHPGAFPRWTREYSRRVVPRVLQAARRILAVSEFTASELEAVLGIAREKIRVVPNAVDAPFSPEGPRADGDYVLAVGTLEPRKNLVRTITLPRDSGSSCAWSVRAAGAASKPVASTSAGSARSPTRSSHASIAARCVSPTRRSTRGSAFRCARRWHAGRPS
jgi:hypothetical protein